MKIYRKKINKNGYTLIEVLIAAAIFAMLITVVVMIFGTNSNIQLHTETIREASQNAKFITEAIARNVRLSDKFALYDKNGISCISNCTELRIYQGSETISYIFENNNIDYSDKDPYNFAEHNINPTRLNNQNVTINNLVFTSANSLQPELKISMDFVATLGTKVIESQTEHLETTISTRNYPNFYQKFTIPNTAITP